MSTPFSSEGQTHVAQVQTNGDVVVDAVMMINQLYQLVEPSGEALNGQHDE